MIEYLKFWAAKFIIENAFAILILLLFAGSIAFLVAREKIRDARKRRAGNINRF